MSIANALSIYFVSCLKFLWVSCSLHELSQYSLGAFCPRLYDYFTKHKCSSTNFRSFFLRTGKASNGHRKLHNTTSLSIPSVDDEMIDITPRNQNYSSSAMGSTNYERHNDSPPHHVSAFVRDRELNDAEGMSHFAHIHYASTSFFLTKEGNHFFVIWLALWENMTIKIFQIELADQLSMKFSVF